MVRALAGDSTMTSLVPRPPPLPLPLAVPASLSEAAAVLLAALLLAGTLLPTSHPRHGLSHLGGCPPRSATPPQVPYAARPRNARPCPVIRYLCNRRRRPYCSRPLVSAVAACCPGRLAQPVYLRTIGGNG